MRDAGQRVARLHPVRQQLARAVRDGRVDGHGDDERAIGQEGAARTCRVVARRVLREVPMDDTGIHTDLLNFETLFDRLVAARRAVGQAGNDDPRRRPRPRR